MYSLQGITTELEATGTERHIVSGECKNATLEMARNAQVELGIWEGTPGSWRSKWDSWEFFTVLTGQGLLTDGEGKTHVLSAGTSVWIPAGSIGLWEVEETLRKSYVLPIVD